MKLEIKGKGKDKTVYFPEPLDLCEPYCPTLTELLQVAKDEFPGIPLEQLEVNAVDEAVYIRLQRRRSY